MMDRGVIALLTGSAVLGILLFVEFRDTLDQPAILPAPAPIEAGPATVAQTPRVEELIQTALARPLFSATRRPPDQATGDSAAGPELPNLRLTGIVLEPDRHLAIFAVPGGKPLARTEGETINEWRLDNIGPSQVSLSGPTGTTILEPKSDPKLVRPKKTAQPAPNPAQPPPAVARAPSAPGVPRPGPVALPPARAPDTAAGPARRPNPTRPAR